MIHETAIVHPGAKLGQNVEVGPYSVIGEHVEIGDDTWVGPHVVINGHTVIGKHNQIYQFSTVGEANQDKKYAGEPTKVVIGDNNVIREHCTIHRGTVQDAGITQIGNDNLFMVNTHIAHDCIVGSNTIFANNATLGGHVRFGDYAIIGGISAVHQFCVVGPHSMIGGGSAVVQDVPPYVMAQGNHAKPFGVNFEGLKRRGFDKPTLHAIRRVYKDIYRNGLKLEDVIAELPTLVADIPALSAFIDFFNQSQRGIIR